MSAKIIVFDIGGTWFRWGLFDPEEGLVHFDRAPAINYLSHPTLTAEALQAALVAFLVRQVQELLDCGSHDIKTVGVSLGGPINANDMTVLGSGPLWGPTARPFNLRVRLLEALPYLDWHVINDITAMLAPYMDDAMELRKSMLITVSSGIGSRLYDHRARCIPYDATYGIQGEIGHLIFPFELDGKLINRLCECGGLNHMNAFASGRGIARTLRELPSLSDKFSSVMVDSRDDWRDAGDDYRLAHFNKQLESGNESAINLLDALVTPVSRVLAMALSLDPEIDRIVITGGVVHGLGAAYRDSLQRTFVRDGLYQISQRDPEYLARRLLWADADDFAGLRGAGIYAAGIARIRQPLNPAGLKDREAALTGALPQTRN